MRKNNIVDVFSFDLLNTSWDMLLTDVKTDEMYKIIINIYLEFAKTCSVKENCKKTPNTPRQKGFDEKKIKIAKENTDANKLSKQRKCTKSDQRH